MIAGKKYYIEAVHREIIISDNLGVAWQLPGGLQPATGAAPIPGIYLSTSVGTEPLGFAAPPAAQTVKEGSPVSFVSVPRGVPPFGYQWLRNGVPIGGATSFRYTIPAVKSTDNDAEFELQLRNASGTIISDPAKLIVVP